MISCRSLHHRTKRESLRIDDLYHIPSTRVDVACNQEKQQRREREHENMKFERQISHRESAMRERRIFFISLLAGKLKILVVLSGTSLLRRLRIHRLFARSWLSVRFSCSVLIQLSTVRVVHLLAVACKRELLSFFWVEI